MININPQIAYLLINSHYERVTFDDLSLNAGVGDKKTLVRPLKLATTYCANSINLAITRSILS